MSRSFFVSPMVAANIATLEHGGDRKSDQSANLHLETTATAGAKLNVSERSVKTAKTRQQDTQQQIADAVGLPIKTVNDKIADFGENGKFSDSAIFFNFDDDGRQIADAVGMPQQTVTDKIAEFTENGKFSDSGIFGNFDDNGRQGLTHARGDDQHIGLSEADLVMPNPRARG